MSGEGTASTAQSSFTILIVDDNKANLKILGATFEDNGFIVHTATDVENAKSTLNSHKDRIDLVLSDIQMPGLSGFDLVQWMKAEMSPVRDIPILLITSQLPDSEHRIKGLSLGAVDYMLRSLDTEELVIRVRRAIESFTRIRNLRKSLESTENLVSTGRLFAASNHEIKNVAQIIQLASNILVRELNSPTSTASEKSLQAVKMLSQASVLLSDVTKMIGGIVSNGDTPLGQVDVAAVVQHVVTMTKPLLKTDVELLCNANTSVTVLGSATFLKQILINLILNARDAIEEGKPESRGRITLEVISVSEALVELKVTDNGVGFAQKEARRSFQPFASTKQMRGGTGLGLWLSSHLTEKMGGHLTLSSQGPACGAEATITLKRKN